MVVPVLITNCQVSENLKRGPVNPQTIIIKKAPINADGLPAAFVTLVEKTSNNFFIFIFIILFIPNMQNR